MRTSSTFDAVLLERGAVGQVGQLVEHLAGFDRVAAVEHDGLQIVRAERGGEPRPDDVVQAHLSGDGIADGLHEALGILDPPGDVVLDDDVLLVLRQKLRRPRVVDAQPPVEVDVGLEGPFHVQAGVGDGADGAAELRDQTNSVSRTEKKVR